MGKEDDEVTDITDVDSYGSCRTGSDATGWVCFDSNDELACQ